MLSELAHTSEVHRTYIHELRGADRLVYSMRARVSHVAIQMSASIAITNLCYIETSKPASSINSNAKADVDATSNGTGGAEISAKEGVGLRAALVTSGACEAVVAAIRQYSTERELLLLAFPALWHLAGGDITTIGRLRAIETQELVAQVLIGQTSRIAQIFSCQLFSSLPRSPSTHQTTAELV